VVVLLVLSVLLVPPGKRPPGGDGDIWWATRHRVDPEP